MMTCSQESRITNFLMKHSKTYATAETTMRDSSTSTTRLYLSTVEYSKGPERENKEVGPYSDAAQWAKEQQNQIWSLFSGH